MSTRSDETRRRIVDAAWSLVEARGAEQLLGGVTLRQVAAAAGLTAPAVTYHFPTVRELGLAMAERLAHAEILAPLRDPTAFTERVAAEGLAAVLRTAAQFRWDTLVSPDETRQELAALRLLAATRSPVDGDTLSGYVTDFTRPRAPDAAAAYGVALQRLNLRVVEPFTVHDLARASAAVTHGLFQQWLCEPDAVRPDLAADVIVAVASATIVPAGRRVAIGELTAEWPPPDGSRPPSDEVLLIHAASVASRFATGVDEVSVSELASAIGCEPATLLDWFATPRRVAAVAFARHIPDIEAATQRRVDHGSLTALTDAVCELSRRAQADPHCALALAEERIHHARKPADHCRGADVHHLVPIPALLRPLLADLIPENPNAATLAEVITDLVLPHAANRPNSAPADIAELALRLISPTTRGME